MKPEEGYGLPDPWAFQGIPKEKDSAGRLEGRRHADAQTPQRQAITIRIHEINDKTVLVDFNHPLARKILNVDVKVTDIKAAEAK